MSDPCRRQGLALVGYRGTGKSTVGRLLAERLGRPFADADLELEARVGRPIAAIFAELGEPAFRDWEERILAELTNRTGAILATGGGVVLRESNRRALRDFGFVVWLTAAPGVLAGRLQADQGAGGQRPALTTAGTLAEIADVLEARLPLYHAVADARVETSRQTPAEVADAILALWPGSRRSTSGGWSVAQSTIV
jgi:shikimate kinase